MSSLPNEKKTIHLPRCQTHEGLLELKSWALTFTTCLASRTKEKQEHYQRSKRLPVESFNLKQLVPNLVFVENTLFSMIRDCKTLTGWNLVMDLTWEETGNPPKTHQEGWVTLTVAKVPQLLEEDPQTAAKDLAPMTGRDLPVSVEEPQVWQLTQFFPSSFLFVNEK